MDEGSTRAGAGVGGPVTRRAVLGGAAAATIPFLLAACGGGGSAGTTAALAPSRGGKASGAIDQLTMLVPEPNRLLDVTRIAGTTSAEILLGLEPLVLIQPNGTVVPNLAKSFDQPDPATYVFTLQPGARFWDGSPVTPEDVAYSFEINTEKGTESLLASSWQSAKSVSPQGQDKVVVELSQPDAQFIYTLGISGIVSKAYREANLDSIGTPKTLNMGSGPFRFTEFIPEELVRLERNPTYWGMRPRIKSLDLRFISEPSAQLLAMQSGNADGIFIVPRSQVDTYTSIEGLRAVTAPGPLDVFFAFNMTQAPWDDIHVRRAFAHAIDRKGLVEAVAGGYAEEAVAIVPPVSMEALLPKGEIDSLYGKLAEEVPQFDLDAARQELQKSPVPDGFSATLLVPQSEPELVQIAEAVQPSLAEIGIKLQIKQVPAGYYEDHVFFTHEPGGVSLASFSPSGPDPSNIPQYALNSSQTLAKGGTGVNIAEYDNPAVDRLLEEQATLPVSESRRRGELLGEALLQSNRELPYLPLYHPTEILGIREPYDYTQFSGFWFDNRWTEFVAADA